MKKTKSSNNVLSRRGFMKSMAAGGGALFIFGLMGNSLTAKDLEVFSEPKSAKGINEHVGFCQCGYGQGCAGSGGGRGQCQCGYGLGCAGGG